MSNLNQISVSANGIDVLYDPAKSNAATHIEDTPQLKKLVDEVLSKKTLIEDIYFFEHDFERTIGNTDLVKNNDGDKIVYAKRKNRDVFTPFNKTQTPQPCSVITINIEKINEGAYELKSTWVGYKDSPPFPGDKNEIPESKSYWNEHSLAWGTQEIQKNTLRVSCPW